MEVRYTPTAEDSLNAFRASKMPSWAMFLFVLLLSLMFVVGIYLIGHDLVLVGWVWLALSVAVGIAVYQVPRVQALRSLKTNPSARGEIVWTLEETGTVTTFATGKSQLQWEAYTGYKETDHVFLLFCGNGRSTAIPKRAMSPELLDDLRKLFNTKIRHS